jgi:hypothetical protein
MAEDVDVPGIYRQNLINVWVEDAFTRQYLRELWDDNRFRFLVAGGSEGVKSLCDHARTNDYPGVYGIVDRDFNEDNYAQWRNPSRESRRYILPAHEIENYLLDVEALARSEGNRRGKSAVEIEHHMRSNAEKYIWRFACIAALARLRHRVLDGFPTRPGEDKVADRQKAVKYVLDQTWLRRMVNDETRITPGAVEADLDECHSHLANSLSDGSWLREFPGKEIFNHVRSLIGEDRPDDVAKLVARWQRENSRIPPVLEELKTIMVERVFGSSP